MKKTFYFVMLFVMLCSITSCSDSDDNEDLQDVFFILPTKSMEFDAIGGSKEIKLYGKGEQSFEGIELRIEDTELEWCAIKHDNNRIIVTTQPNYFEQPRATVLTIHYEGVKRQLGISQSKSTGSEDILIKVVDATATSEETVTEDRALKHSYDGDYSTYFNSKFGEIKEWPFIIEYTLDKGIESLDYLIYHPRKDAGNKWGSFIEYKVLVSTTNSPNQFTEVAHVVRDEADIFTPNTVKLATPIKKPAKVKFEVYRALQNRVSCAEMEFYQINEHKFDYTTIFTDLSLSELKEGVTVKDIAYIPDVVVKELALALLENNYDTIYRMAQYRPYQHPSVMAQINKMEQYSLRDNPTGIYFEDGDEVTIAVGEAYGNAVSLVVQDLTIGYNNSISYTLKEGLNKLIIKQGGLGYILYHKKDSYPLAPTTEEEKSKIEKESISIHILFGKVNGYFDSSKHTNQDWMKLIQQAPFKEIDIVGKRAHITWATEDYRNFQTEDILTIINNFDRLVLLEQQFMGLDKYNKMFGNRLYFHINYGAATAATRNHTYYTRNNFAPVFCDPSAFAVRIWGPAHEVGHINQTRPGLKWAGTTEVTNNILAMHAQAEFGQKSKLLADNTYEEARMKIIDAEQPHCLENGSNEFYLKLVPFWQLKLYLLDACGQESFYKDLYEHYRTTADLDTSMLTDGVLQLDFVRQVCRISGYNLLDFFEKWGFLRAVDTVLNDYGMKKFKITQEQIDELIEEIEGENYDTPHTDIHLIDETNIANYK